MSSSHPPVAVVLLSGGLDSATTLAIARSQGFLPHTLTFLYGQRHIAEIQAARLLAERAGVPNHREITIDLRAFGGSALTDTIAVPKGRTSEEMASGIPVTYVPARNTIFLSYALAFAEVSGASDIFLGVNAQDHAGYPDCRPEFIEAFERLANVATKASAEGRGVLIHAPLIHMSKTEIVRTGLNLGVDYSLTSSCYDPGMDRVACGQCDACLLRLAAFAEIGVPDPVPYRGASPAAVT
ncbi:MAG: 7-cyano-7-deazaguanine synthase QueC [Gemmataceae bacterium]